MSKITAIINQKGGTTKTTTTLNLGYALSEKGNKVLLIDFDAQSSLTYALGQNGEDRENIETLMNLSIEEKEVEDKDKYRINIKENLDLIPCSLELAGIEMTLINVMSRELILRSVLAKFKNDYDYILIDCSPSLSMLTINALVAASSVIIPVTPEYLSAKGLGLLLRNIKKIKRRINPYLTVDGILVTKLNSRTNLSKEMVSILEEVVEIVQDRSNLEIKIFKTKIPISVKTGEAILNKKSILEYDSKNKVAIAYKEFAEEWIKWKIELQ